MNTTAHRLPGRTVLLTGATGGIGVAIAHRLADEGAAVVVTDIDGDRCRELIADLPGSRQHVALELNVADEDSWMRAVAQVTTTCGGLHAVVNNGAIGSIATVEDETLEKWNSVVAVDQTGVWLGMKHCGPLIERSGGGSVVNMCSILGTVGGLGNSIAYHAAKGAVRSMSKNAALHWAPRGVRVNTVHPGFIGTPQLLERYEGTERHRAMIEHTPMGRLGRADEIAGVVAFLVSDDSTYVTGSEIYADGGWTAD
ncbi:MAG: SDR family oxidoreductase [Rhodococcus sp. (in: high G+C Gram-positive bacteria)]|uniref:SDR family NAD(P)-dependent oxidoreductase n=1 Tax=Rhodococcus sp. TaxID=1831 RepID=UPI003BB00C38